MKKFLIKVLSFTVAAVMLASTCFVAVSAGQSGSTPVTVNNEVTLLKATDNLGREVSTAKAGDSSKAVGVFYFLWQGAANKDPESPALDNSKILNNDPTAYESNEKWLAAGGGEYGTTHYWGTPLFDYYRATDSWVVARDVQMLTDAGVDFICIDYSNGIEYKDALVVLLNTLLKFKQQGFNVPKVTFMTYPRTSANVVNSLYHNFYTTRTEYADLWYEMDGKPLMIGAERPSDDLVFDSGVSNYFTFRYPQWPREQQHLSDGFPWMDFGQTQTLYGTGSSATVMSVSLAQHSGTLAFSDSAFYGDTTNRTRSWHNGANDISANAYLYGYNFQEQFDYAIQQDPDIIFVTGWNEWTAVRQESFYDLQGEERSTPVMFIDNADINSSRDIQPMKGGYGDNYYMQLVENIRRYKGNTVNNSNLDASIEKQFATIDTTSVLAQWNNINTEYLDYVNEIFDRNAEGVGTIYTNTTGRNDIKVMKVTNDNSNLYFYAETVDAITGTLEDGGLMSVFINSGKSGTAKWNGYDLVVGRIADSNGKRSIERYNGSGWETVGYADCVLSGNKIHFNVPRSILGYSDNNYTVEFKWADNYNMDNGIDSFYTDGECAPYGRLNYVYSAVTASAPKAVFADANNDEVVNVKDLARFKKNIALEQTENMPDVNDDGEINAGDLVGLAKLLLGCLKGTSTAKVMGEEIPVSGHIITGAWTDSHEGSVSAGPQLSYDGDTATLWNPRATGFNDSQIPSITYDLGGNYSLDKILLTFSSRKYYFKVSVSDDNVVYKQKYVVDSRSSNRYYSGLDCAILPENLNARYIKITFWGNPDNTTYIALNEIKFFGNSVQVEPSEDTRPMQKVSISGYALTGEFENSRVGGDLSPELSYDNNNGTYWNPQVANQDWSNGAGIIYTLNAGADLSKISLKFGARRYYFDIYTSADGVDYTLLQNVDLTNVEQYYTAYNCNLEDLDVSNVRYIKVIFTGNSGTTDYGALYEVSVYGKCVPDYRPEVKATITGHEIVGSYANAQANSGSVGPQKSYDGDLNSKWNPNANMGDSANAGIIYTLDDSYNITKLVLTFSGRVYYFDAYVSADGTSWTQVGPSVRSNNYTNVFSGTVATIEDLNTDSAQYVKIIFKGGDSTWVNLNEVEVFGKTVPDPTDPRPVVKAPITAHEIVGEFTNAQANSSSVGPQKSYDGDTSTKWNPNANFADYANAGIVYTLDDSYNLTTLVLTYSSRVYYFDAYVSADSTNWTQIGPSVRSNNYTSVFNGYVATLDKLNTESVRYVKIIFKGGDNTFVNLNEVEVYGKVVPDVKASITAHQIVGNFTDSKADSDSVGPQKSYDGDVSTKWNPNANFADSANAGVVYTLDDSYNITRIVLTYSSGVYYFDTYVSADNTNWTQVGPSVRSNNYTDVFDGYVAIIDGLNTEGARYVKIVFKGGNNTFVNLNEVEVYGKAVPEAVDTRPVVEASITGHEIVGTFTNSQANSGSVGPQKSYDGDESTKWNPNANFADSANAGIVYTLDDLYNVTSLVLTFTGRVYYFDAYVSADNTNWTQIGPSVRSNNYTSVFDGYVATIDNLDTESARYVKIIFKGGDSTFVNLNEVQVFGKAVQ